MLAGYFRVEFRRTALFSRTVVASCNVGSERRVNFLFAYHGNQYNVTVTTAESALTTTSENGVEVALSVGDRP